MVLLQPGKQQASNSQEGDYRLVQKTGMMRTRDELGIEGYEEHF